MRQIPSKLRERVEHAFDVIQWTSRSRQQSAVIAWDKKTFLLSRNDNYKYNLFWCSRVGGTKFEISYRPSVYKVATAVLDLIDKGATQDVVKG